MAQAIPEGLENRIVPYLMVDGASEAIEFYKNALGATENYRLTMPDGAIGHAEIVVNGAVIYLADAPDSMEGTAANPNKLGGTSVLLHQYVEDVDSAVEQAVSAGATLLRKAEDQFYGDRASLLVDPYGHHWSLHTHIKDVTPEEMDAAVQDME